MVLHFLSEIPSKVLSFQGLDGYLLMTSEQFRITSLYQSQSYNADLIVLLNNQRHTDLALDFIGCE